MNARSLWMVGVLLLGTVHSSVADVSIADVEAAYLLEEYEDVIGLSDRLLADQPGQVDALFLKGAALVESGDVAPGKKILQQYLNQNGSYAREAREMLETRPASSAADTTSDLFFQLGVVHDSRVLESKTTPPFFAEQADQAVRARLAWDLQTAKGWLARYRGYWLNYFSLSEESRFEHAVEGGYLFNSLGGSLEWVGGIEYLMKDYEGDLERFSTRAEQAWMVSENKIGWLAFEFGQDRFPEADIFDGSYYIASLGLEDYRERLSIFYDAYVYKHEAELDSLAYLESGAGFVAAYQLSDPISLGLSLRASMIQFDEFDDLLQYKRDDTYFSARIWSGFSRSSSFSIVPSIEYVNNSSNADFADYDEFIGGIDLIWSR
jgi:hypothetical protein